MPNDKDVCMNRLVRIATIKKTGKKYLVQFIDFRANKVVCWGEVVTFSGTGTRHEGTKAYLLEAVEVGSEEPKTQAMVSCLFDQMMASKREEGHTIDVSVSRKGNIRYGIVPKKW